MQDVKFGQILENACRLAGRNPSVMDIPADWKVLAGMAIESGIHAIAAEKFPLMQRVEFRRYRPDWADGQHYSRKMEVWHGERYWRLEDASAQGEPGVADGWDPLEMSEVAAFIAFDQPWENTVMQSFGVDTTRFTFSPALRAWRPRVSARRYGSRRRVGEIHPGISEDRLYRMEQHGRLRAWRRCLPHGDEGRLPVHRDADRRHRS